MDRARESSTVPQHAERTLVALAAVVPAMMLAKGEFLAIARLVSRSDTPVDAIEFRLVGTERRWRIVPFIASVAALSRALRGERDGGPYRRSYANAQYDNSVLAAVQSTAAASSRRPSALVSHALRS
jgi:hypothetical protein